MKVINSASRQKGNQGKMNCKAGTNCGIIITIQNVKPRKGQSQKDVKQVVTNGEKQWRKKGKEQEVLNKKKKYKPTYNNDRKEWKIRAKLNDKYLPPKNNLF